MLAARAGPRGEHLREIEDETGADIDARTVSGEATIFADSMRQCSAARKRVLDVVGEIRVGDEVRGTVTDVRDYGCVVRFSRSREGLVHKSEYRGWPGSPEELTVGADKAFHVIGVDAVLGVVAADGDALRWTARAMREDVEVAPNSRSQHQLGIGEVGGLRASNSFGIETRYIPSVGICAACCLWCIWDCGR